MQTTSETSGVLPEEWVLQLGTTLIVAPHADDESLGCGGVISLLRKWDRNVFIVLLSDGTLSHPNSKMYPPPKLMALREQEFIRAAAILGVEPENLIFCRYPDRQVPSRNSADFESAHQHISTLLQQIQPQSIFVPWRRDPHPDHRAAYQLIAAANTAGATVYEYAIWLRGLGVAGDEPGEAEVRALRLDISSVQQQKQRAVAAHLSQTTPLIADDPDCFRISQQMLDEFNISTETFYISNHGHG